MKIRISILLFSFFIFPFEQNYAQEILCYEAKKGKKSVGYMETQRKVEGNEVKYSMSYELNLWVLIRVKLGFDFNCTYTNGLLTEAETYQYRDSKLCEATECWWDGNNYRLKRNNKVTVIESGQVDYSTIPIMFEKPPSNKMFSERLGTFLPVDQLKDGRYRLKLPNGNRNYYSYENGICNQLTLTHSLGELNFYLKSFDSCQESL